MGRLKEATSAVLSAYVVALLISGPAFAQTPASPGSIAFPNDPSSFQAFNDALAHYNGEDYAGALALLTPGIANVRKKDDRSADSLFLLGEMLFLAAKCEYSRSDFGEARTTFTQARGAWQGIDNLYPGSGVGSQREAQITDWIARAEIALGRYDDAWQHLNETLPTFRRANNELSYGEALVSLGNIEMVFGRYGPALQDLNEGLAAYRSINMRLRETDVDVVASIADADEALHNYDAALAVDKSVLDAPNALDDRLAAGDAAMNIGDVYADRHLFGEAITSFDRALVLYRSVGNRAREGVALAHEGAVYERTGPVAKALEAGRQARAIATAIDDPDLMWRSLHVVASSEALLGRRDAAVNDYDKAVDAIEALRAGVSDPDARTAFFTARLFVFDEYIEYLLDLDRRFPGKGYDRKALEIFERRQGRAFLEQVASSAAQEFSGVPRQVVDDEQSAAARLTSLQGQLAENRSSYEPDAAQGATLRREIGSARAAQAALGARIKAAYPAYYALQHPQPLRIECAQSPCMTLARFERSVLRRGEAILVYDVLPSQTALWVIAPQATRLLELPASGSDALAARLTAASAAQCHGQGHESVADAMELSPREVRAAASADLVPCATANAALYSYLIPAGAAAMLAQATTLYIVPTGPLYGVPFEALVTKPLVAGSPPSYLIEEKAVAYLSSASLLNVLRSGVEKRNLAGSSPLVAFADPDYTESRGPSPSGVTELQAATLRSYTPGSGNFRALPGSDGEATAAFAALGTLPSEATLYERDRATRQNVEAVNSSKQLGDYRYVLFGTHAILPNKSSGVSQPSIVLAHPITSNDYLTMGDVFGLSLNANAVVLSACDSGSGQSAGDSVEGLTQAFMYAGTPIVAVTDWDVVDSIQERLTPQFFAAMAHGTSAAQALQEAKLTLIHSRDPLESDPYFWAPMVIFGDGDAH